MKHNDTDADNYDDPSDAQTGGKLSLSDDTGSDVAPVETVTFKITLTPGSEEYATGGLRETISTLRNVRTVEQVALSRDDGAEILTDGGMAVRDGDELPSPDDVTRFQLDCMMAVACIQARGGPDPYGLAIKRTLEERYRSEVNHGRLYPNLDKLADMGLLRIERKALDDRTNRYTVTDRGIDVLYRRLERLADATGTEVRG